MLQEGVLLAICAWLRDGHAARSSRAKSPMRLAEAGTQPQSIFVSCSSHFLSLGSSEDLLLTNNYSSSLTHEKLGKWIVNSYQSRIGCTAPKGNIQPVALS